MTSDTVKLWGTGSRLVAKNQNKNVKDHINRLSRSKALECWNKRFTAISLSANNFPSLYSLCMAASHFRFVTFRENGARAELATRRTRAVSPSLPVRFSLLSGWGTIRNGGVRLSTSDLCIFYCIGVFGGRIFGVCWTKISVSNTRDCILSSMLLELRGRIVGDY